MYHNLQEFWRVGHHESPLTVTLDHQGGNRFDDPQHEFTVLYGGDCATTCILEVALPWSQHINAAYVSQVEAPDAQMDADEQQIVLDQAERDREIAKRPPTFPVSLYDKSKVFIQPIAPVVLCDLDNVSVRSLLARIPAVASAMEACDVPQLDRSVILAQGPHLDITRAISGFLMREQFEGQRFAGIRTLSRLHGTVFVLFEGHYKLGPPLVGPIRLHREDSDVVEAALMTRFVP